MSKEKRQRLGRGLAALLGSVGPEDNKASDEAKPASKPERSPGEPTQPLRVFKEEHAEAAKETDKVLADDSPAGASAEGFLRLAVAEIDENPFQPRREFRTEEIDSLSASLEQHDMLQPVLVRKKGQRFELISGERRLRAARQAGWTQIPAQIREADDRLVAELAIVENLQRKDLNPIEKAMSFRRYLDEHKCPQEELARRLGIDRSTIANLMRLLELPKDVRDQVRSGQLSAGHARALLPLGEEQLQVEFASRIRREGLSVRAIEQLVQERNRNEDGVFPAGTKTKTSRTENPQVASLEQELRMALGTKVDIKQTAKGRGRIVIQFKNHAEFERIRAVLTDEAEQRRAG